MTKTFYDVLGVTADASPEDVRAAYRARLKESHPDLSDAENATERTRRIVRARDVLTDEDERARYDRLGHDEYVGDADATVDDADVSSAANAARRAGWADGEDGDTTAEATDDTTDGTTRDGGSGRARERRQRERAARERVGRERSSDRRGEATPGDESTGRAGRSGKAADTTPTDAGAAGTSQRSVSESPRSWNGSDGFSVRQSADAARRRRRLIPTGRSLTLLAVTFALYPLMLFSALFPPFPLPVNVVVGLCTIFLIGYLQSQPAVGVVVFGTWSLLTPALFLFAEIPLTGLVGIAALSGTWLPLGLTVLTLVVVRP